MGELLVAPDNPGSADVQALLEAHLAFSVRHSAPGNVHALDAAGLLDDDVSLFSAREEGRLLGIAALKHLDGSHAELKSMHIAKGVRGRGIGRAVVDHLLAVARSRGYVRVSLETGSTADFAPARGLYASMGFRTCGPFADYTLNSDSVYMVLDLEHPTPR